MMNASPGRKEGREERQRFFPWNLMSIEDGYKFNNNTQPAE